MAAASTTIKSIVLTGGPSAGKTLVCAHLQALHRDRLVVIPEAATQIYRRMKTGWNQLDVEGRRELQRCIYRLQLEQEALAATRNPGKVLLLDRGTVDGAAYWPDGPEDYWRRMDTTLAAELARYDAVFWLESSAAVGCYRGAASNDCRFENAAEALACGQRLARLWQHHARFGRIPAFPTMAEKLKAVEGELGRLLNG